MADRKITDLAELTSPVAADLLPIVVAAEPTAANKNKKIQYGTFLRNIPSGTVGAPSIAWTADTGVTGFYRSAANEIAFTTNSTFQGKFTTAGFQLGTGTAAAQLHLFSADTTDQVIIENTDAGLDTAPDVVLYRNSASPANNDNLGNLEFRGKDSAGNDQTYAQILSTISTVTNTSEVGILDLMSADAGVSAMRLRLKGQYVGISEGDPIYPLHVSSTVSSTALQLQCTVNDASSGGDITMYRRRGAATVGQNNDLLSTIYWRGHNNNATTEQVDYAAITGSIVDVTNNLEDGKLEFKVQADGAMTTEVAITAANTTLFSRPILPTHTPASSTATGTTGEIAWDSNFIYVATGTNTWRKVGISVDGVPGSFGTFPAGTAAAPSIAFTDDTNTGLFNFGADQISVTTGGTERLRVDSNGQIEAVSLGTAAAPVYSFTTDSNTGVYSPGADQIAFATNGIQQLLIDTAATTSTLPIIGPVGSATAPTFTFTGRTNTGIYSSAASTLNLTAGGTLRLTLSTTAFTATLPWRGQNGSVTAPAFSFSGDTNTGIYSTGVADEIAITTGGVQRLLIGATGNSTFTGNVLSSSATGGVGYATGAGGAVTQLTSRTTGVTLDKICGAITLVSAAGTATWQSFTVTNSTVAATDNVIVNQKSGTDLYMIHVTAVAAGSFRISFATTGGTTTEQPVFNFSVVKAVAA